MIKRCLLALLFVCLSTTLAVAGFEGEWDTTFGRMSIQIKGDVATGTYSYSGAVANDLTGTIKGNRLTFEYHEQRVSGEGYFELNADGTAFDGKWHEKNSTNEQAWSGKRPPRDADFAGVWKTSFGPMRIIQQGDKVVGCYNYRGRATFVGSIKDKNLSIQYTEPDGSKGTGEFTLAADRQSLVGKWSDGKDGGDWNANRLNPVPGKTWLVVLEANWETNLQQNEYSFGDMLKSFFTRVPSVEVRHRNFQSKVDFVRWCNDIVYLPGPTVFYVASHGTEEGISVGQETIDGATIGEALRYAGDVKLLHLGSCLTMAGKAPSEIQQATGINHFPISGYTKTADWAGSAVIDFAFMELVLARQIDPVSAAKQVRDSVLFSSDVATADCVIAPTGFCIVK